ncbi:hypothetical protein Tco_0021833 [Tanacetum coccineum]
MGSLLMRVSFHACLVRSTGPLLGQEALSHGTLWANIRNRERAPPVKEELTEKKHQSPKTFEKSSRKSPNEAKPDTLPPTAKPKTPTKQTPSPAKAQSGEPPREKGKNPFFLAKWFGFAK